MTVILLQANFPVLEKLAIRIHFFAIFAPKISFFQTISQLPVHFCQLIKGKILATTWTLVVLSFQNISLVTFSAYTFLTLYAFDRISQNMQANSAIKAVKQLCDALFVTQLDFIDFLKSFCFHFLHNFVFNFLTDSKCPFNHIQHFCTFDRFYFILFKEFLF